MVSDTFFVNIRYMFNGDRLAFVRTYHIKSTSEQVELPLEVALPNCRPSPRRKHPFNIIRVYAYHGITLDG